MSPTHKANELTASYLHHAKFGKVSGKLGFNAQMALWFAAVSLCVDISDNFKADCSRNIWASSLFYPFPVNPKTLLVTDSTESGWPPLCSHALCRTADGLFGIEAVPLHTPSPALTLAWTMRGLKCKSEYPKEKKNTEQHLIFSQAVAASSSLQPFGSNPSSQPIETLLLTPSSSSPSSHSPSQALCLHGDVFNEIWGSKGWFLPREL